MQEQQLLLPLNPLGERLHAEGLTKLDGGTEKGGSLRRVAGRRRCVQVADELVEYGFLVYWDAVLGIDLAQLPQLPPFVVERDRGEAKLSGVRDGVEPPGLRGRGDRPDLIDDDEAGVVDVGPYGDRASIGGRGGDQVKRGDRRDAVGTDQWRAARAELVGGGFDDVRVLADDDGGAGRDGPATGDRA